MLVLEHPERIGDFLKKAFHLFGVDSLHFFQQAKVIADLLGDFNKSAQVLGKATAAEPEGWIQEATADPLVHSHAEGDFLDIGACRLTKH